MLSPSAPLEALLHHCKVAGWRWPPQDLSLLSAVGAKGIGELGQPFHHSCQLSWISPIVAQWKDTQWEGIQALIALGIRHLLWSSYPPASNVSLAGRTSVLQKHVVTGLGGMPWMRPWAIRSSRCPCLLTFGTRWPLKVSANMNHSMGLCWGVVDYMKFLKSSKRCGSSVLKHFELLKKLTCKNAAEKVKKYLFLGPFWAVLMLINTLSAGQGHSWWKVSDTAELMITRSVKNWSGDSLRNPINLPFD